MSAPPIVVLCTGTSFFAELSIVRSIAWISVSWAAHRDEEAAQIGPLPRERHLQPVLLGRFELQPLLDLLLLLEPRALVRVSRRGLAEGVGHRRARLLRVGLVVAFEQDQGDDRRREHGGAR